MSIFQIRQRPGSRNLRDPVLSLVKDVLRNICPEKQPLTECPPRPADRYADEISSEQPPPETWAEEGHQVPEDRGRPCAVPRRLRGQCPHFNRANNSKF